MLIITQKGFRGIHFQDANINRTRFKIHGKVIELGSRLLPESVWRTSSTTSKVQLLLTMSKARSCSRFESPCRWIRVHYYLARWCRRSSSLQRWAVVHSSFNFWSPSPHGWSNGGMVDANVLCDFKRIGTHSNATSNYLFSSLILEIVHGIRAILS